MKVVIVGGGTLGISVATKFRRCNEDAEIVILEKSDHVALINCALAYYLSGEVEHADELFSISKAGLEEIYNIKVKLNSEVEFIDREKKIIKIKDKDSQSYDKLVLSTGALQLRPDIPGIMYENIFTIGDVRSVEKIKNYIKDMDAKKAIIVGGGYIGLEFCDALTSLGLQVTIVEKEAHLMPTIDCDIGKVLEEYVKSPNVDVSLSTEVSEFFEKKAKLSSGKEIDYDLAIIATGTKPDVKIPVMSDLEIGKTGGMVVNPYLQTSDLDIYAGGDDVEVLDKVTKEKSLVKSAGIVIKQARVIASNLCENKVKYEPIIKTMITAVKKKTIASCGATEQELQRANMKYNKFHLFDYSSSPFLPNSSLMLVKFLFGDNGEIFGAQILGEEGVDKRIDVITAYIQNNATVWDLQNAEVAYAPKYGGAKDVVNSLGSMAVSVLDKKVRFIMPEDVDIKDDYLVDVRPPEIYEEGHIEGAVNIPKYLLRENIDKIPHHKRVVLYCNRSRMAYSAAEMLQNHTHHNVYVLSGGFALYSVINAKKVLDK